MELIAFLGWLLLDHLAAVSFVLATSVGAAVLAYVLRNTRSWWVTAVALGASGVFVLLTLPPRPHDVAGSDLWSDLAPAADRLFWAIWGMFLPLYALFLALMSRRSRAAHLASQPAPLPPAWIASVD